MLAIAVGEVLGVTRLSLVSRLSTRDLSRGLSASLLAILNRCDLN